MSDFNINITADATKAVTEAKATQAALQAVGTTGVAANTQLTEATTKATSSKAQLKAAIKGVASEFPIVGRVASMALNPITIAVAGLATAFTIWQDRMQDAMRLLGGIELPDISNERLSSYEKAATAWETFAKKVKETSEAYNSLVAASERQEKGIDKQSDREKKALENQKKMDLARLEMSKGGMSDAEHAMRKAQIEARYDQGEMAITERAERRKLEAKFKLKEDLEKKAREDLARAQRITPPSEDAESKIGEDWEAQAAAARKAKAVAEANIKRLEGTKDGWHPIDELWGMKTYGVGATADDGIAMEQAAIKSADEILEGYRKWGKNKKRYGAERQEKAGLVDSAAGAASKANELGAELPGEVEDFNANRSLRQGAAVANQVGRLAGAIGTSNQEHAKLSEEAARSLERNGQIASATGAALERQAAVSEELAKYVKNLEARYDKIIAGLRTR